MIAICREIDKDTGKIAVYPLDTEVNDRLLFVLNIRARANPELSYYVTTKAHYSGFGDVITSVLKRKRVTPADIARVGGLVQI